MFKELIPSALDVGRWTLKSTKSEFALASSWGWRTISPMPNYQVASLINLHCQLGENPLWNVRDKCIYWEDIDAGQVHRFNPASQEHQLLHEGPKVGGFTFQANGDLLLFRVDDIVLLRPDRSIHPVKSFKDEGSTRFNDVIADPKGRVFAGTIGANDESGGLFRVDLDGSIRVLFRGTGCSNGMGFSPDLKQFYWTCSTTKRIYRFPYNLETGELGDRTVFYEAPDKEGITDGMTVDMNGHVWSARWDGYSIVHHGPDGHVLETISLPVAKVTSLCFGGPKLDQFFITTAGGQPGSSTADGTLYRMNAPTSGFPEFNSRILLRG